MVSFSLIKVCFSSMSHSCSIRVCFFSVLELFDLGFALSMSISLLCLIPVLFLRFMVSFSLTNFRVVSLLRFMIYFFSD